MFTQFVNGRMTTEKGTQSIEALPWHAHPTFPGVFLKNVLTGEQTGGLFTCHLVRIEPHHAIGSHAHPNSMELHEVLEGSGVCVTDEGDIPYSPGCMGLIAAHCAHEVKAGEMGLCLLAKFVTVPA